MCLVAGQSRAYERAAQYVAAAGEASPALPSAGSGWICTGSAMQHVCLPAWLLLKCGDRERKGAAAERSRCTGQVMRRVFFLRDKG